MSSVRPTATRRASSPLSILPERLASKRPAPEAIVTEVSVAHTAPDPQQREDRKPREPRHGASSSHAGLVARLHSLGSSASTATSGSGQSRPNESAQAKVPP